MVELFANSGGPDQTPCSMASDLGLHGLPVTHLGVFSLQWVKIPKRFIYLSKLDYSPIQYLAQADV